MLRFAGLAGLLLAALSAATIHGVSAAVSSTPASTPPPSASVYAGELAVIVVGYSVLILEILVKYRSR